MTKKTAEVSELLLAELVAIKKLMVFQLLNDGASQKQIATALGVNQSQISRMFPNGSTTRGA